jgi:hypothetical protein
MQRSIDYIKVDTTAAMGTTKDHILTLQNFLGRQFILLFEAGGMQEHFGRRGAPAHRLSAFGAAWVGLIEDAAKPCPSAVYPNVRSSSVVTVYRLQDTGIFAAFCALLAVLIAIAIDKGAVRAILLKARMRENGAALFPQLRRQRASEANFAAGALEPIV